MVETDIDQVLEIERASFASPWRREHFLHEIERNSLAMNLVLRKDGSVLAYACVWHVGEELKINNVAVRADRRGRGIGRWIVTRLLDDAGSRGCTVATLEVRPSNVAAIRLYEGLGFVEAGRRKGYYAREGEDAILMELRIAGTAPS